jgi:hypothetical protein
MLALYSKRGALVLSVGTPKLREVLASRALIEPGRWSRCPPL